jgi:ubiquitin-protein ligase
MIKCISINDDVMEKEQSFQQMVLKLHSLMEEKRTSTPASHHIQNIIQDGPQTSIQKVKPQNF